jgi:hypothetical protein
MESNSQESIQTMESDLDKFLTDQFQFLFVPPAPTPMATSAISAMDSNLEASAQEPMDKILFGQDLGEEFPGMDVDGIAFPSM